MIAAAAPRARAADIEQPEVVLADAGYWHQEQMQRLMGDGSDGPRPAQRQQAQGRAPGLARRALCFMRRVLATEQGGELYAQRQGMIEPVFAHTKFNRRCDRFLRRGRAARGRNGG